MAATIPAPPNVQHVPKSSSDQLLRKFAEMDSESQSRSKKSRLQIAKPSKRSRADRNDENCETPVKNCGGLVEQKSLLPPRSSRRGGVLRQIGIRGMSQVKGREMKKKSLLGSIEKTWRRTIEGASRMLMENHYNRHKRLINDGF